MNVVWVEDFGGTLPANEITLKLLFKGLIKSEVFNQWGNEVDLLNETEILTTFFEEHSNHKVVLLKNVFDYQSHVAQGDVTQHDVFVTDINLTQNVDHSRPLPHGMEEMDSSAFHKKAGFYIYNHLVRKGVPPDNICFLTGEESTSKDFGDHCQNSLIPRPIAFEKSDGGYTKFRTWLDGHKDDPYLSLRRAVIEGCEYLKKLVAEDKSAIQFGNFIRPERDESSRERTSDDMCDYLGSLQQLLPARKPSDTEKKRLFRLFVRSLAHEWEDAASPTNLRRDLDFKKRSTLRALGWIMKNVRNWMSHTAVIDDLDERNVAFLFFVNMRAMFDLGANTLKYEQQLLGLFEAKTDSVPPQLDEVKIRDCLLQSYKVIKERIIGSRQVRDAIYFNEMINNLVLSGECAGKVNFVDSLYQLFWHGLSPAKLNNAAPAESRRTGEKTLAIYFSFDCRCDNYRAAPDQPDDYLHQLARTIFQHSFQQ